MFTLINIYHTSSREAINLCFEKISSYAYKYIKERGPALSITVIINNTKYLCQLLASEWVAICAAVVITGPKRVGPARETL